MGKDSRKRLRIKVNKYNNYLMTVFFVLTIFTIGSYEGHLFFGSIFSISIVIHMVLHMGWFKRMLSNHQK